MTTSPDHLSLKDRRAMLATMDGLRSQLDLVCHRIVDQPQAPIPDSTWQYLMVARLEIGAVTGRWIN